MFAFLEGIFQPMHLLVIGVIAILLFGKRLPEIARSLGKSMVEFKKGLKGLEDEIQSGASSSSPPHQDPVALQPPPRPPQRVQTTAPKFEDNAGAVTTPPQQAQQAQP
jgi:sec-independent protein translocase protein TatA